jgi:hypothetical protein
VLAVLLAVVEDDEDGVEETVGDSFLSAERSEEWKRDDDGGNSGPDESITALVPWTVTLSPTTDSRSRR